MKLVKINHLKKLWVCQSGVAFIEFFFISFLVLIPMFFGLIEVGRLILIHQKLDKTANTIGDIVSQGTSVTQTDLNNYIIKTARQTMRPFGFNGSVILTSIVKFPNPPPPCPVTIPPAEPIQCAVWQDKQTTGTAPNSKVSPSGVGVGVTLPGGYTLEADQNVIVAEIFMSYEPLLGVSNFVPGLQAEVLYKVAVFKPRQGTLTVLLP